MIGRGKGDITAQVGKTLKAQEEETHRFLGYRVVGTGLGVPPEETPKIVMSPFPFPIILISTLNYSRDFIFPSYGMSCSTSTFPQQGISIFPTPSLSGVPRRGIATPLSFQTLSLLAGATAQKRPRKS
jgi:hypothetical protein